MTRIRTVLGAALITCVKLFEHALALISHSIFRLVQGKEVRHGYVVGVEEIAGLVGQIADALPDSVTVTLFRHPFYDRRYTHSLGLANNGSLSTRLRHLTSGPILLGRLAARHETFVFVGGKGFLQTSSVDGRDWEFAFLRRRGVRVVCYFTGSEIRSPVLMAEFAQQRDLEVITTYQALVQPWQAGEVMESRRRALARSADEHANITFNAPVDQMSHLEGQTHPFLYFQPDESIGYHRQKWLELGRLRLVHAPSWPIIKGTPLVRAAVKALRMEGYDFEYTELVDRPHSQVTEALNDAHIVLNEFYAFMPGVFGVEALAANTVLMTSADSAIEPSLPPGANNAWVVTPYWAVYATLKRLLDHPDGLQEQADRGTDWVRAHCSRSASALQLRKVLDS